MKAIDRDNRLIQKMELVQYRVREELLSAYLNQNDPLTEFLGFPNQVNGRETDSLIFTTLAQTRMTQSSPVSHLEGVQYILFRQGGSRLFVFMHEQNTNLLSYGIQAVLPEKMLSRVWSMKIRYFDGTQWTDRWNSLQTHTLPLLVKIDLVVEEKKGRKKMFEEEVQLPSSSLLQILGGSGGNQIPGESGSTGN